MSKKKSLGSSPIGFQSKRRSMGFIPDLGVTPAKARDNASGQTVPKRGKQGDTNSSYKENSKKKIVSYNLEVDLIEKVKSIANQKDMYYSSLVSTALKSWFTENS